MTLYELFAISKQYFKRWIVVAVALALVVFVALVLQPVSYAATASLKVINGDCIAIATRLDPQLFENEGIALSSIGDVRTGDIYIVATGSDSERCVQCANEARVILYEAAKRPSAEGADSLTSSMQLGEDAAIANEVQKGYFRYCFGTLVLSVAVCAMITVILRLRTRIRFSHN